MKEMELSEKSGNIPNREGETPRNGNISINSISGANLLKGVKKNNSNENLLSSSKILILLFITIPPYIVFQINIKLFIDII